MRAVVAVGGQYWSTTTHAVVTAERPAALQSVVSQLASRRVSLHLVRRDRCSYYDYPTSGRIYRGGGGAKGF